MAVINFSNRDWTLIASESPTFAVLAGTIEILGTTGSAPSDSENGVPYSEGTGEKASADILAEFTDVVATRLYARAVGSSAAIVVFES